MADIVAQPLTPQAFAPYGDVIEMRGAPSFQINGGMCDRYHDLARLDFADEGGRACLSIGHGRPYQPPLELLLVERHPLGSQAFMPLDEQPFLVIVAPDEAGKPGLPLAFLTSGQQGVNYHKGTWHGVLTPIHGEQNFLIIDRAGPGKNCEEYVYSDLHRILLPT